MAGVSDVAGLAPLLASFTFQNVLQRSGMLAAAGSACREVEGTLAGAGAMVGAGAGAMVGTGAGAGAPPTWSDWALYTAFSAAESAFHCMLKLFSLSLLDRDGGRRGRCSRQNTR